MQLVGTIFHGHKVYERTKKREAVRWGLPFNTWLPLPSFNHGGATYHWKGKVKGPDLCGPSLNLCLPPLKQKQPILSPCKVEPSPEMFKMFFIEFLPPNNLSEKYALEHLRKLEHCPSTGGDYKTTHLPLIVTNSYCQCPKGGDWILSVHSNRQLWDFYQHSHIRNCKLEGNSNGTIQADL